MMRRLIAVLMVLAAPLMAQVSVGETGACSMAGPDGVLINLGACKRMPASCTPETCEVPFHWMADDFDTVITLPSAMARVSEGRAMNGQEAYAPAALAGLHGGNCIYNAVSEAEFCWFPGGEAFTLAVDGVAAWEAVQQTASGADVSDLLAALQGKYRPVGLGWDCGEVGRDGGAMAIEGDQFLGLESVCLLTDAQAVGGHGAVMFQALCSGEGENWRDEYILRRDDWGQLAVLRADAVSLLEACE